MAIKPEQDACGTTYTVECDECGDVFVEGAEDFYAAVAKARVLGVTKGGNAQGPRRRWYNYCADCAAELED